VQGRRVELMELDDASLPAKAEAAARSLANDSSILGVVGHHESDCSVATQLIFREAGLAVALAGVPNREKLQLRSPTEFRILPLGNVYMKRAADYAWETLGARTFTFIRDEGNFGLSMLNQFRAGLTPHVGRTVTGEVMIRAGQGNFGELVGRLNKDAPQYIVFGGKPREGALLLAQLREAGNDAWFHIATQDLSQEFIDFAHAAAEGALAAFPGAPPEGFAGGRAFLAAYAARGFEQPASNYGIYAYASAQTLLLALERSFLTRPSVVGAMGNEQFDTALGPIRYQYLGSTYQGAAIYKVREGRWVASHATDQAGKLLPYAVR
jgi:branched-chain amino acid transport system substrate-binding protein